MPITEDVRLPSYDELDVQDVNVSQPVLIAAATYFGKYCDQESKEYMLCKLEEKDPRKCLNEGKAVTMCGHDFFRKVAQSCKAEVERMAKCLEWTDLELKLYYCNKERKKMDMCFDQKMGMKRTPYGYFSQLRLHETERPKPKSYSTEFKNPGVPVTKEFHEDVKKLELNNPLYGMF